MTASGHFHTLPHPKEHKHPDKLSHTHQCLVCNLGKLTTKIENMLVHQIERACDEDYNNKHKKNKRKSRHHRKPRSKSRNAHSIEYDEMGFP